MRPNGRISVSSNVNRVGFGMVRNAAGSAVLALASMSANGAWAQSAEQSENPSTFRLPVPTQAPPRAAGPADDSGAAPSPIATRSAAPPVIALPAPTSTPVTRPTVAAPAQRAPVAAPRVKPRVAAAGSAASPAAVPIAVPSARPVPTAAPSLATPEPTVSTSPEATPGPAPATTEQATPAWLYAALGAVLALAAGGFVWWRRKQAPLALPAPDFIPPDVAAAPAEDLAREPIVVPAPDFANPVEAPAAASIQSALSLTLEATRMSATLFNATLAYRLVVTNDGPVPLSDIEIGGDMTSAHASRSHEEQLGLDGAVLAPLHGVGGLAPGEAVTLGGDLRLPLSAILPIRRGDAQLFVPLARFAVQARDGSGEPVTVRRAFLVGQSKSSAADKLQPFRLDLGPRLYSELGQRGL